MTDMEAENTVRNIVWQNCNGGEMPELDTELKDLNLDSLSFIAVIVGLEEAFGFEFKDEKLNVYGIVRTEFITRVTKKQGGYNVYYLKEGVRHNVEVREGTIDYMVGKLEYRTSIGLMMTAYVDLRFTSVDEHGQRRFKKDFRDCIVEEVTVKKKVGTDQRRGLF